jgi:hypothetical protein
MYEFAGKTQRIMEVLTSVSQIWRRTTPNYELKPEEKERVLLLLNQAKTDVEELVNNLSGWTKCQQSLKRT